MDFLSDPHARLSNTTAINQHLQDCSCLLSRRNEVVGCVNSVDLTK